jgi:dTDP-glucose 4,6-dehydratase
LIQPQFQINHEGSVPRTLVTGGAGFLGSHLCEYLLNKGHEVICMDNLITGTKDNISDIKSKKFQFVEHNVSEFINLEGELDYILHFASPASPIDYLKLPIQTLKVGALGTHNALGLAKAKKAVFFLASTSEVYGDPLIHPQPEDYWGNVNPVGPRGVYDEAKRFAEAITMAYHRTHGINTKIIRIFNTFGPRMRINDGRAIPNFLKQALTGKDLTIYGDGSQTRSFCYVSDLVEGIYRLLTSDQNNPINIGNPNEMTIKEMADKILQATNSKSKITYVPLPEDDPKVRQPDITRAKKYLNWEPVVGLGEGLQSTLKYFKEQLQI